MTNSKTIRNNGTPSKRKFKGFNFYIQCNEKLSQKNRERLLRESEVHLNDVTSSLNLSIDERIRNGVSEELDPSHTDFELLDEWNQMYDEYGYLMSEFKERWEKEKMGKEEPIKIPTVIQTLFDEIESLRKRISQLENQYKCTRITDPIVF
jgi:hypothetical protein